MCTLQLARWQYLTIHTTANRVTVFNNTHYSQPGDVTQSTADRADEINLIERPRRQFRNALWTHFSAGDYMNSKHQRYSQVTFYILQQTGRAKLVWIKWLNSHEGSEKKKEEKKRHAVYSEMQSAPCSAFTTSRPISSCLDPVSSGEPRWIWTEETGGTQNSGI